MEQTQYIVTRPAEYDVRPQYRPAVTESHLSKYVLEVDPLAFDENRASFSWRSPGLGVLQKSTVEIAFTMRVNSKLPLDYLYQMGPQLQITSAGHNNNPQAALSGSASKIAFGSGDAMQKAITSLQVVVNGAALSQVRQRDYMRSLQNCWFEKQVFQKRFNECGGTPNKYDAVAVQGEALTTADGAIYAAAQNAPTPAISGFTGDSGLKDRLKNVMAAQIAMPAADANNEYRDIRVRWKVNGTGLFSPLALSDRISHSCPYKQSARALPNMNVVSLNILFSDLKKALFRNLSTFSGRTGLVSAQSLAACGNNAIVVTMPSPKAKLYVEYLRLPGWRQQVDRAQLQTFRVAIHDPTTADYAGEFEVPAPLLDGNNPIPKCLPPIGVDRVAGTAAPFAATGSLVCQWNGLTAAQIPEYLFVVCEKRIDLTNHANLLTRTYATATAPVFAAMPAGNAEGRMAATRRVQYMARNTDANLAITRFQLEIMSVQGSYIYSAEEWPYVKSQSDLYRDVAKYCVPDYDDKDTWLKHNCIVLLGVQEYAKGISTSGTAFPCTFTVQATFENRRSYVDGYACASPEGAGLGACQDIIGGRPVLGMIYPQQRLEITASSALLTSQNISHASATEILARKY